MTFCGLHISRPRRPDVLLLNNAVGVVCFLMVLAKMQILARTSDIFRPPHFPHKAARHAPAQKCCRCNCVLMVLPNLSILPRTCDILRLLLESNRKSNVVLPTPQPLPAPQPLPVPANQPASRLTRTSPEIGIICFILCRVQRLAE